MKNLYSLTIRSLIIAFVVYWIGYSSVVLAAPPARALPIAIMNNMINGQPLTSRNDFTDPSRATFTIDPSGSSAILRQFIENANVHFQSFDIGAEARVDVIHPSNQASTVGHIYQNNPSQIFGTLNVTTPSGGPGGRIILLNQNGFVFGPTARIGRLDATSATRESNSLPSGAIFSSLNLNEVENGEIGDILEPITRGQAAFIPFTTGESGEIIIEEGAQFNLAQGGDLYLIGTDIENRGDIDVPGGQVLLLAGETVYLQSSPDITGGVIAEVTVGGTVTNGSDENENPGVSPADLIGRINADQGIVTLLGKTVNQQGLISASTSVTAGGKIRLIARDTPDTSRISNELALGGALDGGELTVGRNSVTIANPDLSDTTESLVNDAIPQGEIELFGEVITLEQDSLVQARSGLVSLTSLNSTRTSEGGSNQELVSTTAGISQDNLNPNSLITLQDGAVIDVSGLDIDRDLDDLSLAITLRSNELSNNPENRETLDDTDVVIDITEGTEVADVNDLINSQGFDVAELSLVGGTVSIQGEGRFDLSKDATINVGGGSTTYSGQQELSQTILVDQNGRLVSIDQAPADQVYTAVLDPTNPLAGLINTVNMMASGGESQQITRLIGRSAGTLDINVLLPDLQGNLIANTSVGDEQVGLDLQRFQIDDNNPLVTGNQRPLGGNLIIGNANTSNFPNVFRINNIEVTNNQAGLRGDESDLANLTVLVPSNIFAETNGNFSEVTLAANSSIIIPEATNIVLPTDGVLELNSSEINFNGDAEILSGSVILNALRVNTNQSSSSGVTIGNNANINLSGSRNRVNEVADTSLRAINGGTFTANINTGITQQLQILPGANIDVSGGFLITPISLDAGNAGSINLIQNSEGLVASTDVNLSSLKGFGTVVSSQGNTAVGRGGSLRIDYPGNICVSTSNCTDFADPSSNLITPQSLQSTGFSSFEFTALEQSREINGVDTLSGFATVDSSVALRSDVIRVEERSAATFLDSNFDGNLHISDADFGDLTQATDFSLTSAFQLTVNNGARLSSEPGANISLNSDQRIFIDGQIIAEGGSINLGLTNGNNLRSGLAGDDTFFTNDTTQTIWLGSDSLLDVSGAFVQNIMDAGLGLRRGTTFNSGSIELNSDVGFIITEQGSQLDASGFTTTVDSQVNLYGDLRETIFLPLFSDNVVISDAGSVSLTAAEGFILAGNINLQSALPGVSQAGSLSLALDPTGRGSNSMGLPPGILPNLPANNDFNIDPKIIRITESESTTDLNGLQPGQAVPDEFFAPTQISQDFIQSTGAGSLSLATRDISFQVLVQNQIAVISAPGEIQINSGVDLNLTDLISLDTSVISVQEQGNASYAADIIRVGSTDSQDNRFLAPTREGQDNSLSFNANLIDIFGDISVADISDVNFVSSGDIRLFGNIKGENTNLVGSETELTGSLNLENVDLLLSAQQIYPGTLTQFAFNNVGDNSVIRTSRTNTSSSAGDVLSAGGEIILNSQNVEHGGILRAPLGTITINAQENIDLLSGSIVSVSTNGELIPFGRTLLEQELLFDLSPSQVILFGEDSQVIPEKEITLVAQDLDFNDGALLDVSAGGDLLSSEFVPGPTGTIDFLAPQNAGESFAVLPLASLNYAPIDPQLSQGFSAGFGESIEIDGSFFGLTGTQRFVKLPAQYATLPGAFLITPVDGFNDLQAGQSVNEPGGGVIVGARTVLPGNGNAPDNLQLDIFRVESQTELSNRGEYRTSTLTELAERNSSLVGDARLPNDAGVITLQGQTLNLEGDIFSEAPNGLQSELRIAAENIIIVGENSSAIIPDGFLSLVDEQLNNLNAGSFQFGTTGRIFDGVNDNIIAQEIIVEEGVFLQIPETIFAAKNNIQISDNVEFQITSDAPVIGDSEFQINGEGALFIASSLNNWTSRVINPIASGVNGNLQLGQSGDGLNINADTSVLASATNQLDYNADSIASNNFRLVVDKLNFGQVPLNTDGTSISDEQLARLDVENLFLSASQTEFFGISEITANNFTLESQVFNANELSGDVLVNINVVDNLSFIGGSQEIVDLEEGLGEFNAQGRQIEINGTLEFDNFANINLITTTEDSNAIIFSESGSLNSASNFSLSSSLFDLANGIDFSINSLVGDISLVNNGVVSNQSLLNNIGGHLDLVTNSGDVLIDSYIAAHSGEVNISAVQGSTTLADEAFLNLSGLSLLRGREQFFTSGGNLIIDANDQVSFVEGSVVDLQGSAPEVAGGLLSINISSNELSLNGDLLGNSSNSDNSAIFNLDISNLDQASFANLNAILNESGFSGGRSIRARTGDLELAVNDSIQSRDVSFSADSGSVIIAGSINASSELGGNVELYALNDVEIQNTSSINARTLTDSEFVSSRILLSSRQGQVNLAGGAQIDLQREFIDDAGVTQLESGGELYIRTSVIGNDVAIGEFASTITGSERVVVEAVQVINEGEQNFVNGTISAATQTSVASLANQFDSNDNIAGIEANLNALNADDLNIEVTPGIELFSENDITVASRWDFSGLRFSGNNGAGVLTLRSAGNVNIDQSITDGFVGNTIQSGNTWSYNIVAGADATAANFTQVSPELGVETGNIELAAGTGPNIQDFGFFTSVIPGNPNVVRTGNGDIAVHAASDIIFGDNSNIYTVGSPSTGRVNSDGSIDAPVVLAQLANLPYLSNGGDLIISSGGNITGGSNDKYVNDFLFKTGNILAGVNPDGTTFSDSVGWTVNTTFFNYDIGALGGGNVSISTGGAINNVAVALPSIGEQVGGATFDESDVNVIGGGLLNISAQGDIAGGTYYVGRGEANISTEGVFGDTEAVGDSLAGGDTQFTITARQGATVGNIFNPTLLPRGPVQDSQALLVGGFPNFDSGFSTYSGNSSVSLTTLSGDAILAGTVETFFEEFNIDQNDLEFGEDLAYTRNIPVAPSSVEVNALNGNLIVNDGVNILLAPSIDSSLKLIAQANVVLGQLSPGTVAIQGVQFGLPDIDLDIFPSIDNPVSGLLAQAPISRQSDSLFNNIARSLADDSIDENRNSTNPLHGRVGTDGTVDNESSLIVANTGSITFNQNAQVDIAEPLTLFAGENLINPSIVAQNIRTSDVTQVLVGNEIIFETDLQSNGQINANNITGIAVDGPGRVDVITGGDVDLGSSLGIISRGNLVNTNLSNNGADINLLTGVGPNSFDERVTRFTQQFILASDVHDSLLNEFLVTLGAEFVANSNISNPADITEFAALEDDQIIAPLVGLSPELLSAVYQLGLGAGNVPISTQKNVFSNLSTTTQYDVVQSAFFFEIFAGGTASQIALLPAAPLTGDDPFADQVADAFNLLGEEVQRGRGLTGFYEEFERSFNAVTTLFPENAPALDLLRQEIGGILENNPNIAGAELVEVVNNLQAQNSNLFFESANTISPFSGVFSRDGGDLNVINPFGFVNAGINIPPTLGLDKSPADLGYIAENGNINFFVSRDLFVNESRLVGVGDVDISLISLFDNLDAGSGALTAVAAPAPQIFIGVDGNREVIFTESFAGSGIRTVADSNGNTGSINLFTPYGQVVAGDAGIQASNALSAAALDVVDAGNIGGGDGVSISSGSEIAAPTINVSGDVSAATTGTAGQDALAQNAELAEQQGSLAAEAATFLNVVVLGVGG